MRGIEILAVEGVGEVSPGDRLSDLLAAAAGDWLLQGDVMVVTQKVVSKAEGRMVEVDPAIPFTPMAVVEAESVRVLRRRSPPGAPRRSAGLVISETSHGFVCANAGVDVSNVPAGWATLLPVDPDRSARRIRDGLRARLGIEVGVVVSDTFGRPWRRGATDVAIGCAGVAAVLDLRGTGDAGGRLLHATEVAVADELASAAELVMGKASGVPAAVVRGVPTEWLREASVKSEVVRPPAEDLFR